VVVRETTPLLPDFDAERRARPAAKIRALPQRSALAAIPSVALRGERTFQAARF